MTKHDQIRARLLREREVRAAAYAAAVTERDALVPIASATEALPFDRSALKHAESIVTLRLKEMAHWGDPLPEEAETSSTPVSTARGVALPLPSTTAVEDHQETVEAVAARIINSDLPDSAAPGTRFVTSAPETPARRDAVDLIVARILNA